MTMRGLSLYYKAEAYNTRMYELGITNPLAVSFSELICFFACFTGRPADNVLMSQSIRWTMVAFVVIARESSTGGCSCKHCQHFHYNHHY